MTTPTTAADTGTPRGGAGRLRARMERWRPVVLPTVVLWLLATVVTAGFLHPFDVTEYERYAHAALRAPLLHRFPLEYPAPALVVFLLPLLVPLGYQWAFAVVAGVALMVLVSAYDRAAVAGWDARCAGRLIVYLALGSVMVLTGRFDVFAAAATLLAVRAARRERWSAAWTWSAAGVALKLFPAALWPVFVVAEWRRTGRAPLRRLWWVAGSAALVAGVPALLDPGAALNVAHYYLHRPVEMGSLPAGLSVLFDAHGTGWVASFHSENVVSGVTGAFSLAVEAAAVCGCAWTWWAQARGRLPMQAACLLTLTLAVLGSKVLSVQYLIWLMPLWALYRLRVSWLLASLANLVIFPYVASATKFGYVPGHAFALSLTLTFFVRDVLIAAGTWAWLRSVLRAQDGDVARGRHGVGDSQGRDQALGGEGQGHGGARGGGARTPARHGDVHVASDGG